MSNKPSTSKKVRFGDPDYESTLVNWYNEEDDIGNFSDEDSVDESYCEESEHETDSEIEAEDSELPNNDSSEQNDEKSFYGRNRYKWSTQSFVSRSRTQKHNIIVQIPGLRPSAALGNEADPVSCWNLLFTDDLLLIILQWTNVKLQSMKARYKNTERSELQDIDLIELKAFIGLLFYTAVFKSNHEKIERIFTIDGTGREIFRCVMSKNRFATLLVALRFDNPVERAERRKTDPLAPISEIFNKFVPNCQRIYTPGANMTIDEMLISFRGRCKYKMYIPNKPCKYGLKLMCLADARNHYFYNGYLYCGKNSDSISLTEEEKNFSKPTQSVIRLARPIQNTNRNITADNWFSSLELAEYLREKGLTYVGTLKKNKREIPPSFLPHKNREVGSALYGFTKNVTLVSHVPKKNKAVLLISSMHHSQQFDDSAGKPEIIVFYNSTKSGVDSLDEKCAQHSTGRRTQRWPMAFFFRLLDISGVNAYVIHQAFKNNSRLEKADFLKILADELVKPHLHRRVENTKLKRDLRATIKRILRLPEPDREDEVVPDKLEKRKTCYTCPSRIKRKTFYLCKICHKPTCLECASKICQNCKYNL